ncbi:unnamed protein product [Allacma fusca]|uniref:Uncharacterized protein n=1 Tax=Allacma fusca TaxID=39272 RepID=A0A8J2KT56_9HEXA|nr:unnamed protein product [Allacma fusca]
MSGNFITKLEFKFGIINYCYNPKPLFEPPTPTSSSCLTNHHHSTSPQSAAEHSNFEISPLERNPTMLASSQKNRERFAIKKSYSIEVDWFGQLKQCQL